MKKAESKYPPACYRAAIHRGESASWTNGEQILGFNAGHGVVPCEVYLPPPDEWRTTAPPWAKELRATIVGDFHSLGVSVVESRGAALFDGYRRPGVDP